MPTWLQNSPGNSSHNNRRVRPRAAASTLHQRTCVAFLRKAYFSGKELRLRGGPGGDGEVCFLPLRRASLSVALLPQTPSQRMEGAMLLQRGEISKQSTCGEKQNMTTNNTRLMQMLGKCVRISISHICARRDGGAIVLHRDVRYQVCRFICSRYLQTSVYSSSAAAVIPRAPPKRPRYLLFGWVCVVVAAPDVGGKSRGQNASGAKVERQKKSAASTVNWRRELYLGIYVALSGSLAVAVVVLEVFGQSLWDDAALSGVDSLNET